MAEKPKAEPTNDEKMDAWGKRMDAMCDAMTEFMAKHAKKDAKRAKDDDDEGEGEATEMAADDAEDEGEPEMTPGARRKAADAKAEEAMAHAQQRADNVARHWGLRAPMPQLGESVRVYRRRALNLLKQHSPDYRRADLALISDKAAFDAAEKQIFADAIKASSQNSSHARLHEIQRMDQSGRLITEFVGPVSETLAPFRSQVFRVKRINNQPSAYGYLA